jgi:inosine/xanthosine triphosphate pyrophosphatase family protein
MEHNASPRAFLFQGRIVIRKWHNVKETADILKPLMSKHLFERKIEEIPTLSHIIKRAGLTFLAGISKKIANIMTKHSIQIVAKDSGQLS